MTIDRLKSTNDITSLHPGGGGVLPYKRLTGMCCWMGSHFHNWSDYNGVANNTRALPQPSLRYREASAEERDTQVIALSRFSYTKTFCRPLLPSCCVIAYVDGRSIRDMSSHNQLFAEKSADEH